MRSLLLAASVLLAFAPTTNAADLRLATVFADHMVLQRDNPVPIWGWANPGEKVTVEFAAQRHAVTTDSDGKWQVSLQPLLANAQPQVLSVHSEDSSRRAEVADVLVGEVWLGSGQSNMAMLVRNARNGAAEEAASNLPRIRVFTEKSGPSTMPNADARGEWVICSPATAGTFSATLFFFGRELHRSLDVPVGLIVSAVGGTPIESWIAAEQQQATPELKPFLLSLEKEARKVDPEILSKRYQIALDKWKVAAAAARAQKKAAPRKPRDPNETAARKGNIGGLFNGKIAPLIPYAIRGAIWYQGEANTSPDRAGYYQHQLPLLITDWRARWGEEFPFAWVQLPNYDVTGRDWPTVREGMLKTLSLPNTGMAITIDIGDKQDIHPKNKQGVGKRLAQWALGSVYDQKGLAISGPIPASHQVHPSKIVIRFDHADGGLRARDGELSGFLVAGKDQQWKTAVAQIDGDSVVVSSDQVLEPVAVRYAWANDPECNLINGADLPATPFQITAPF